MNEPQYDLLRAQCDLLQRLLHAISQGEHPRDAIVAEYVRLSAEASAILDAAAAAAAAAIEREYRDSLMLH